MRLDFEIEVVPEERVDSFRVDAPRAFLFKIENVVLGISGQVVFSEPVLLASSHGKNSAMPPVLERPLKHALGRQHSIYSSIA